MKIFGIDPGLRNTGWGVIIFDGHKLTYCDDGIIKPKPDQSDDKRLHHIASELDRLMQIHQPDMVCIEDIFVAKNPSSALKLGMARGAAITAVARHDIPMTMIAARRVKQNITGSGRADKTQVTAMVSRLLGVTPKGTDSADALAIAIAGMNDKMGMASSSTDDTPQNAPAKKTPAQNAPEGSGLAAAIEKALAKESSR